MLRGFTLIEMIITIALSLTLMVAATQLYVVYGRTILVEQASINLALGGSSIMDSVRSAGLQANHVVTSHIFSGVTRSSGSSTVIFELPSIDAAGDIIIGSYDYVAIYASGTSVYRVTDAAAGSVRRSEEKLLTTALDALSFTYDSASFNEVASVTASATTSALVRGATTQKHFYQHIYLRNI